MISKINKLERNVLVWKREFLKYYTKEDWNKIMDDSKHYLKDDFWSKIKHK
jgi:hypothetical protein